MEGLGERTGMGQHLQEPRAPLLPASPASPSLVPLWQCRGAQAFPALVHPRAMKAPPQLIYWQDLVLICRD